MSVITLEGGPWRRMTEFKDDRRVQPTRRARRPPQPNASYRWYSIWRRHRRFFRPYPPFPMFSRRLRGGLRCFNVLTPAIVFNWVVIRLKIIVIIFPTFLSTELYVFEIPVISYSPLYYAQK